MHPLATGIVDQQQQRNHRSSENNNDPIVPFVPLQFERAPTSLIHTYLPKKTLRINLIILKE